MVAHTTVTTHKIPPYHCPSRVLPKRPDTTAKLFNQWQCSFQMKAALPLVKKALKLFKKTSNQATEYTTWLFSDQIWPLLLTSVSMSNSSFPRPFYREMSDPNIQIQIIYCKYQSMVYAYMLLNSFWLTLEIGRILNGSIWIPVGQVVFMFTTLWVMID